MQVKSLFMKYGNVTALNNISFQFPAHSFVGVIGQNGSGKTTLLECFMGLRKPMSGEIDFSKELAGSKLNEKIGAVLQENNFYDSIKVKELLILFSTFYEDCYEVNDLMDRLRISDLRDRYYHELSGGMKQRVNLALAFLNKPSIVILDEPTTGLDPFARREFWNNLKDMARNTTVFLSSHYMEEIQQNCDSLIFLNKGDLIYSGAMSKLLSKYDKPDLEEIYMKTIGGK
ncbi:MAG: ABC transporter ATP-binding protein [Bacilli bacterium]|uniref:ABC transporter ATP-binding protein n=1 Tax=Lactobacillus TaxID=1578 RepID=UPI000214D448|nr:ABC transporter ATP-binding protein [Lactobacillus sp. PV034]MCI6693659.1 ABC transporter ATP-binding protein [Clostridium sp.]MCI6762853.1 ABC transporter ATP-binding protein [Lactobacillus johnsonii]MCI7187979.1 ABC transporter ATP-binding protein [Fusobacterium mortiferum]MDY5057976.1 ABC transporter ATP-binding protein [Bacilli bacterium]MCI7442109.1 ABC transporter ATP-binding protein [Clostridium sp.]